jgi:phosphoglycerol transferase MdoB-like AlkP superfamily enzyme
MLLFRKRNLLNSRFAPVWLIILVYLSVGMLTRIVLMLQTHDAHFSFTNVLGQFAIGLFFDLFIALVVTIPLLLHIWFTNEKLYSKNLRPWVIAVYLILIGVLIFTDLVPKDFNEDLRKFIIIYFIARLSIYTFLSFTPEGFRLAWRKYVLFFDVCLYFFLIFFNAISEYFFWDEFSSRYNFIAVDYLVYTTEVIGNIKESYPVEAIVGVVLTFALMFTILFRKNISLSVKDQQSFKFRSLHAIILLLLVGGISLFIKQDMQKFSRNSYANELAGNGVYSFTAAFMNNELDYFKYYKTISEQKAFDIVREDLKDPYTTFTNDPFSIERMINDTAEEKKMNVVLISVESFSASFMKEFGNDQHITPFLDSLAQHSLFFTNLYASGTRTVRGLEALSLSIPPTPGQSVVKRPHNNDLFTLGHVFRTKGYNTQYIYGGYSYFDNMKGFFGGNGYEVIDRDAIPKKDVDFANVWGVCDEDLFDLALDKLDQNYKEKKNFFTQIMTVSNHRPFTYPEGRIDISPEKQVREGAVKYTDYAIGRFIKQASKKPWFNNTIFVIVSDHCAGSAGYVELPVTGYHIPMLIYNPSMIQPQKFTRLTAQIDIAPTILGLLHFDYTSKFFGRNILAVEDGKEHAFISTYQGLGYLQNNKLVIQSPKQTLKEFEPDFKTGGAKEVHVDPVIANKAIAYYQVASWLLKNNKQGYK